MLGSTSLTPLSQIHPHGLPRHHYQHQREDHTWRNCHVQCVVSSADNMYPIKNVLFACGKLLRKFLGSIKYNNILSPSLPTVVVSMTCSETFRNIQQWICTSKMYNLSILEAWTLCLVREKAYNQHFFHLVNTSSTRDGESLHFILLSSISNLD